MVHDIRVKKLHEIYKSIIIAVLLCSVALLTGCGKGESASLGGAESVSEASEGGSAQASEGMGANGPEGSRTDTRVLEPSPLIHAENPQEENMADMLQDTAAGVMVQVRVGDTVGSGVIWDRIGDMLTVATAAHVYTSGNGVAEVTFVDGWTTRIAGYEITDTDLAFLFVSLSEVPEEQLEQYYMVNVSETGTEGLQKDDGVILMGAVTGVAAEAYEGKVAEPWIYVEDFGEYMIVVNAEAEEGMSGGGLFDYEGHFLGILCGKSGEGEAVVLPQSVIKALYGVF